MNNEKRILSSEEQKEMLEILKKRFEKNIERHKNIEWNEIQSKLKFNIEKLWILFQMEKTGGEPDLLEFEEISDKYIFIDYSAESPKGRRSICYDQEALESRKNNKPKSNAVDMATYIGVEILTEDQYRKLQTFGEFDKKTSSWIKTPDNIRKLGGALFCDRRYGTIFVYHNSAGSYYSDRGFRGLLKV
jgi:hypothetical protein